MWENILGNEQHKKFLEHYLTSDNHPHALLFVGAAGLGKRLLALEFAESLLCHNLKGHDGCQSCKQFQVGAHPDFVEISLLEDKKTILIEQVRELIAGSAYAPTLGKNKVILINDADLMRNEAANAILKILEEPPESWTIILTATKEELLLPTILSRVVTLRFKPISEEDIQKAFLEKIKDEEHATVYAKLADGSIGGAVALFEKDGLELRQNALELLMGLPTKFPMNLAALSQQEMEERTKKDKDIFLMWLRLLQLLLRDALMLKVGLSDIRNADLQFELNKVAANAGQTALDECLAAVERANTGLFSNLGVKRVMEELILDMNESLERR